MIILKEPLNSLSSISQFRQLEEISEDDERLPPSVKLTLLQTAVRSINDLRIVETLDEFQSTTHGHGSSTCLSYDTYCDLLLNACVSYDKTKKANIGKRRNVYATNMDDAYVDLPTACIDDVPDLPYGGLDLPPDEFYQGSDVRILSRSSRKCTVTGIDSHELQGLDVVQCAALVETNHGIVNLILNEYACYGKGHTLHSSGQIEWFKNSVDDRSVQVGGKQRICTTDGYSMPLTCKVGLMYLSILGKPTDQDLERYPAVHLTGPHEWDPSVLDYTHPSGDGEPPWSNDPDERYAFDPNFDEFGDYTQRAI